MPTIPLVMIKPTTVDKSYVLWRDSTTNRWAKEEITRAQYDALVSSIPRKPAAYTGTREEWTALWISGRAKAISGRVLFDTSGGGAFLGAARLLPDGRLLVYLGDLDNDRAVMFQASEYTGTPPLITVNVPIPIAGVSVSSGLLTAP